MLQWLWKFLDEDGDPALTRDEIECLSKHAPREVAELARSGDDIRAIYLYRKRTCASLRKATAVIKALRSTRTERPRTRD